MILYRVEHINPEDDGQSQGYTYHATHLEAEVAAKGHGMIEGFEFSPTKTGILRVLAKWGGHADNG